MLIDMLTRGYSGKEIVFYLLIMLFALTISFSVHEFMHAFVAVKLGDNTPRFMGRLTLNPQAHIDPIGAICMLLAGFGWGKPVLYNPSQLKKLKSKRAMKIMVSLGGVTANFLLALVCRLILITIFVVNFKGDYSIERLIGMSSRPITMAIILVLFYTSEFSMSLLAFNLIPIPPLDGFQVLLELLPYKVQRSEGFRSFLRYGPQVLFFLILLSSFIENFSLLSTIMGFIRFPFDLLSMFICQIVPLIAGLF